MSWLGNNEPRHFLSWHRRSGGGGVCWDWQANAWLARPVALPLHRRVIVWSVRQYSNTSSDNNPLSALEVASQIITRVGTYFLIKLFCPTRFCFLYNVQSGIVPIVFSKFLSLDFHFQNSTQRFLSTTKMITKHADRRQWAISFCLTDSFSGMKSHFVSNILLVLVRFC